MTLAKHAQGSVYIEGDYAEFDLAFKKISDAPTAKGVLALEAVLFAAYEAQKAATHIETGSLKASTTQDSETRRHTWEGTITAGGFSTGVNNPVDYAIYEKARGGAHDFQHVLDAFEDKFAAAMLAGMD